MSILLVIIGDKLSSLLEKGEITERYYNPGNLFEEVHILMTNNDKVNSNDIKKTVGDAKLFIHNILISKALFFMSIGYRPELLEKWAEEAIKLAKEIKPSIVRCHGNQLNCFIAYRIKKELDIPYVVSIHNNPDEMLRVLKDVKRWFYYKSIDRLCKVTLKNANKVLLVYKGIVPYIERLGIENYDVVYNVLNGSNIKKKEDYNLKKPVQIITVSRQLKGKNPGNIIKALKLIDNVELTVIGDGPYHLKLKAIANKYLINGRVRFIKNQSNDVLCSRLQEYDLFVAHSDYMEIPKAVIEPLLVGLPVIVNQRKKVKVPEYRKEFIILVENKPQDYYMAIKSLVEDDLLREATGRSAQKYAWENWSPENTEVKVVEIYKNILNKEYKC